MTLIDIDKFLASFITEMKECSQMRNFSIPRCIKKALDDQGLEYKDGEIVKSQRRIVEKQLEQTVMDYEKAFKEAYERASLRFGTNVANELFLEYKESKEERTRRKLIEFFSDWSKTKSHCWGIRITDIMDWLEKQGEMDMESYKTAEDEKREFVGDGFIKCYADFQDFKEGETYWLEYIGNDNYNVRSDNLLGKTYHITPCQLYTIFKKQTWLEKKGEQKPAEWSEEDEEIVTGIIKDIQERLEDYPTEQLADIYFKEIKWLKSIKQRISLNKE